MKTALVLLAFLGLQVYGVVQIARDGKAAVEIVIAENAATTTQRAAQELAQTLRQITGAQFAIIKNKPAGAAIFVGQTAATTSQFGETKYLVDDEILFKSNPDSLLLTGGGPRGDLYAVTRFLQQHCGVRWWTAWASTIPKNPNLNIASVDYRYKPPFELREPFWYPAFDPLWAMRNTCNGQSAKLPPELGGSIQYKGFVHTFYPLVPPEKHFADHPEWYSLINGKRTHDRAQLCTTNPQLRAFLVDRVKQWLRESPDARIISVSQNDWYRPCECDNCKALDTREGSHSGTMLDLVNYVADEIKTEFPQVSVDTLAYQYTRKPPKTLRPRANVIVRLCSIECNFREPLDHLTNGAFDDDIKGWSAITDRLYIWDYTTDFSHYLAPHPNYFTLGANVRYFAKNSVRGLFEQGAYQSHGSEFCELRGWVLAQLLWNPNQDDRALIREFLNGYYGADAAKPIAEYLQLMTEATKGYYLTCFNNVKSPFLNSQVLARAEKLFVRAEAAVQTAPDLHARVRLARLPLLYVWLARWDELHKEASDSGLKWPVSENREHLANDFLRACGGQSNRPWTKVTLVNEGGTTPEAFVNRVLGKPR
jgi:hypothetical protein